MFKAPPSLKESPRFANTGRFERVSNYFYWTCLIISGVLFGWLGFWMNYHEIGPKSHPGLALPVSMMFFVFVLLIGGHFSEVLPSKWKYIAGILMVCFSIVATDPVGMATYTNTSKRSQKSSLQTPLHLINEPATLAAHP